MEKIMPSDSEIAKPFIKATVQILETMAQIKSTAGAPYVKKNNHASGEVSAIVGVTGDRTGSMAVTFDRACAIALVKGMLGEDDLGDMDQEMQDAVGEVANMVSGQGRAGLTQLGLTLQGSTPTVIMGDKHIIRHISKSPVIAIPFTTPDGDFTVEFCFE